MIPNNVRTVRLTAAAGTNLARASSRDQSRPCGPSSPSTGVYNPKAFVLHAASLGQACAHCRRFSTAASRRSLGSVSVPVCRATLARPVGIAALVGRYPANKLIPRRPVPRRRSFGHGGDAAAVTSLGITRGFPRLYPIMGLVTVALLTLAPLALRPVRLACLIHAANVHSEPGSNPSRLVGLPCPEETRRSGPHLQRVEECANWSQLEFDRGKPPLGLVLSAVGSVSVAIRPPTKRGRGDSDGSTPASLKGSLQPTNHDRPDCQRTTEPSMRPAGATCLGRRVTPAHLYRQHRGPLSWSSVSRRQVSRPFRCHPCGDTGDKGYNTRLAPKVNTRVVADSRFSLTSKENNMKV